MRSPSRWWVWLLWPFRSFPFRERAVRLVELEPRAPEHPELRQHLLYEIDERLFAEETHHWSQLMFGVLWWLHAAASVALFLFGTPDQILVVLTVVGAWAVWRVRESKAWVVWAVAAGVVGSLLALASPYRAQVHLAPLVLVLGCAGRGWWLSASHYFDVFAVTDKRVLRLRGPLSKRRATVPIGRILDITVEKPVLGRMLGYGHLIFESAAQVQGLRDIRFMRDPDKLDRTIQLLVHGEGPPPPPQPRADLGTAYEAASEPPSDPPSEGEPPGGGPPSDMEPAYRWGPGL